MLIRPAARSELDAVQAIYAIEVLEGTGSFEIAPPDHAEIERRYRTVLDRGLPYLVADIDGEIGGFAYAHPYKDRPGYRLTAETSIYLARDHRRQGIGSALLSAVIEAASQAGIRQLVAVIGDSANQGSIRVHEKAGFHHVGTLADVGYKFERFLDVVIMQRSLVV
ncbi:MAG: GNAT family N-acetyltransferase [Alphaproteobacteria bacterium]|nr:GNAT family N-acetyltransferase [Alphaproteobacteria bacterium]